MVVAVGVAVTVMVLVGGTPPGMAAARVAMDKATTEVTLMISVVCERMQ